MLDRKITCNSVQISIQQDLSLSHAGTVWDGALCMIEYFNKNKQIAKQYLQQKVVLQLGSGTGILGIGCSMFRVKNMFLTDLEQYLGLIQKNKQKNIHLLNNNQSTISICPLVWNNHPHIQQIISKFPLIDTIIGSQLSYDIQCTQQLMLTVQRFKQINPDLKVMICYQKYKQEGKNIQKQFVKFFGNQYKISIIDYQDMNEEMRDQFIGIVTMI